MTTRQIEKCFDLEDIENVLQSMRIFIFDPYTLSKEEAMKLASPTPGSIVKVRRKGGRWGTAPDIRIFFNGV